MIASSSSLRMHAFAITASCLLVITLSPKLDAQHRGTPPIKSIGFLNETPAQIPFLARHNSKNTSATLSSNHRFLATQVDATNQNHVLIYDLQTGQLHNNIAIPILASLICISNDAEKMALRLRQGSSSNSQEILAVWTIADTPIEKFRYSPEGGEHPLTFSSGLFANDGNLLTYCNFHKTLCSWRPVFKKDKSGLFSGKQTTTGRRFRNESGLQLTSDGDWLIEVSNKIEQARPTHSVARFTRCSRGSAHPYEFEFPDHFDVKLVRISNDGARIAITNQNHLSVWDTSTQHPIFDIALPEEPDTDLFFLGDNHILVNRYVVELSTKTILARLRLSPKSKILFSPGDGRIVVAAPVRSGIAVSTWNIISRRRLQKMQDLNSDFQSVLRQGDLLNVRMKIQEDAQEDANISDFSPEIGYHLSKSLKRHGYAYGQSDQPEYAQAFLDIEVTKHASKETLDVTEVVGAENLAIGDRETINMTRVKCTVTLLQKDGTVIRNFDCSPGFPTQAIDVSKYKSIQNAVEVWQHERMLSRLANLKFEENYNAFSIKELPLATTPNEQWLRTALQNDPLAGNLTPEDPNEVNAAKSTDANKPVLFTVNPTVRLAPRWLKEPIDLAFDGEKQHKTIRGIGFARVDSDAPLAIFTTADYKNPTYDRVNLASGKLLSSTPVPGKTQLMDVNPGGNSWATKTVMSPREASIQVWGRGPDAAESEKDSLIVEFDSHEKIKEVLFIGLDNIVTVSDDTFAVRALPTGKVIFKQDVSDSQIFPCSNRHTGIQINNGVLRIIELETGETRLVFPDKYDAAARLRAVAISPSGRQLAVQIHSSSSGLAFEILNLETQTLVCSLKPMESTKPNLEWVNEEFLLADDKLISLPLRTIVWHYPHLNDVHAFSNSLCLVSRDTLIGIEIPSKPVIDIIAEKLDSRSLLKQGDSVGIEVSVRLPSDGLDQYKSRNSYLKSKLKRSLEERVSLDGFKVDDAAKTKLQVVVSKMGDASPASHKVLEFSNLGKRIQFRKPSLRTTLKLVSPKGKVVFQPVLLSVDESTIDVNWKAIDPLLDLHNQCSDQVIDKISLPGFPSVILHDQFESMGHSRFLNGEEKIELSSRLK